jgi:hypothetical protein
MKANGANLESDRHHSAFDPTCEDAPYPKYRPGNYEAQCVAAVIYRDPRFAAWKCRLEFRIIPDSEKIFGFFHLGTGPKPHAGRGSIYRKAWIIARGEQPRKRQSLSRKVFVGKIFYVRIADTTRRFDGGEHPEPETYSTVKEILEKRCG